MTDDYFQLSWDVVQKLLLLKNNQLVQLNKIQCGLLTDKLSETLANVRAEIDTLPPRKQAAFCKQQCREALQELYRVVTEAAIIIRGCCIQDWLTAAVKLINNTEAFVDPFFQLDWCASVIAVVVADQRFATNADNHNHHHHHHHHLQRHHSVSDQKIEGLSDQECESKMETIRSILKPAALEDHGSLAKRLQAERAAQKTSSTHGKKAVLGSDAAEEDHDQQEVKIVANMLKLKPTSFDNNSNASKKVTAAFLPNIEPRDLTFVKRIGGGSFGDVFEVRWLGQKFAKKTFQGFENESFKHEAAILAGLSHPHIVRLFGISIDKRHGCSLVMELMSEDLRACMVKRTISYTDQAPFELAVALDIMLQIAEGMEYLHHRRITHRDLKSSNILVNPVECLEMAKAGYVRAKVADFGLAKTKDTSATFSLQSMVGTTRWRAPELFEMRNSDFFGESADQTSGAAGPPHRRYPMKADVYSYAVTCSEILTGDIPFKDEKLADLSERIKYAGVRPHLPASVPPYLASLIERSWDADPSKRPSFSQICGELRHLKASLLIGGEQLVQSLRTSTYSAREWRERKTMYQAFLDAADVEEYRRSESVTRVLLIGSPTSSGSEANFMGRLCNNSNSNNSTMLQQFHNDIQEQQGNPGASEDHDHDAAAVRCNAQNINNAWKHETLPLCIHVSQGISDNMNAGGHGSSRQVLDQIGNFLKKRNSNWTSSSWLAKWQVLLRKGWLSDRDHGRPIQKLNNNRVHGVWLLYSPHETVHLEWTRLKDELGIYELPVQFVLDTQLLPDTYHHHHQAEYSDSGDPITIAEHNLQKNFLDKRGFIFPNVRALQDQFIIVPPDQTLSSSRSSQDYNSLARPQQERVFSEDEDTQLLIRQQERRIRHEATRQLTHLDPKALWASAEVIKTIANIQQTAEIICDIASRLGKRGTNIAIAPFMMLPRRYTLGQSGIFTLKCLCKIWEVPKPMEAAMLKKTASWELGETQSDIGSAPGRATSVSLPRAAAPHEPTSPTPALSLADGRYLHFSVRVAGVILYCKARHPKGWIQDGVSCTDYMLEFNGFYSAYKNQFDEFTKNTHYGISFQFLHSLFASSDHKLAGANLKQQLQSSLEDFFVDVLNRTDFSSDDLVQ